MSKIIDVTPNGSSVKIDERYEWYIKNGYYVEEYGAKYIVNTNLKPGDRVRIRAYHYNDPRLYNGSDHVVEKVTRSNNYYSEDNDDRGFPHYKTESGYVKYPTRALIKLVGVPNAIKASSVENISGANNMTYNALPSPNAVNRTALVQEVVEETKDGKTVLTPKGAVQPFDNVESAQAFIRKEITDTIRKSNEYRQFKLYQEIAVAKATEPPVTFS